MSNNDNDWSRSPVRLVGAQPQNTQSRPHSTLDDRVLSLATGVVMGFLVDCCIELSDGTYRSPSVWIALALCVFIPIYGARYVIRKFKIDFKERDGWMMAGFFVGFVVFMPLIITPKCGWWGDKCKPVHSPVVRHVR